MDIHPRDDRRTGYRNVRVKATRSRAVLCILALCAALSGQVAHADAVAHWNRIAIDTVIGADETAVRDRDVVAVMNIAMFEALNFVRPRFRPHFVVESHGAGAVSGEAAAAAAAHQVLVNAYPARQVMLDGALSNFLEQLPEDDGVRSAVVIGASIAATVRAGTCAHGDACADDAPAVARAAYRPALAHPLAWHSVVTELIAARMLALDEAARIHALTSIAAAQALVEAAGRSADRCAECIVAASVAYILASELGIAVVDTAASDRDRESGRTIARSVLLGYYRPAP